MYSLLIHLSGPKPNSYSINLQSGSYQQYTANCQQYLPASVQQIPSMPRRIFLRPRSRRTCLATSRFSMYLKKRYRAVQWITTNVHPHTNTASQVNNGSLHTHIHKHLVNKPDVNIHTGVHQLSFQLHTGTELLQLINK